MSKPVAAVRLEETITRNADPDVLEFGQVIEGVREKLAKLSETHFIVVLSPSVKYARAAKLLYVFLTEQNVPFGDIWLGEGLPSASLWIDNNAKTL